MCQTSRSLANLFWKCAQWRVDIWPFQKWSGKNGCKTPSAVTCPTLEFFQVSGTVLKCLFNFFWLCWSFLMDNDGLCCLLLLIIFFACGGLLFHTKTLIGVCGWRILTASSLHLQTLQPQAQLPNQLLRTWILDRRFPLLPRQFNQWQPHQTKCHRRSLPRSFQLWLLLSRSLWGRGRCWHALWLMGKLFSRVRPRPSLQASIQVVPALSSCTLAVHGCQTVLRQDS